MVAKTGLFNKTSKESVLSGELFLAHLSNKKKLETYNIDTP